MPHSHHGPHHRGALDRSGWVHHTTQCGPDNSSPSVPTNDVPISRLSDDIP
eukprot:gene26728-24142_t